jgi:hypothetical protein
LGWPGDPIDPALAKSLKLDEGGSRRYKSAGITFVRMKRRDDGAMTSKGLQGAKSDVGRRAVMRKDSAAVKPRIEGGRGLDARSQDAIGRSLKAHYEDLVRAPVPDKFLEMLDRLEAAERSKPKGADDEGG